MNSSRKRTSTSTVEFSIKQEDLLRNYQINQVNLDNENVPPALRSISNGTISSESQLYTHIIPALKAQLKANAKRGVLPDTESKQLSDALDKVMKELSESQLKISTSTLSIYDVISSRVAEIAPEAFKWFDIAKAEPSQRSGDLRLWLRSAMDNMIEKVESVASSCTKQAEENVKTLFPLTSNSQLVQPSSLGHHMMAYVCMLLRDVQRAEDARNRLNESPYGASFGAGNSYPINLDAFAKSLAFDAPCANALDAVASRDFALECLSVFANCATNISRMLQSMIQWNSNSYMTFGKTLTKDANPMALRQDAHFLHAARAKCSRIIAKFSEAASLTSRLEVEFSDDLNQLSEIVVQSYKDMLDVLDVLNLSLTDSSPNLKKMKDAASRGYATSLDLVDWIAQNTKSSIADARAQAKKLIEFAAEKSTKLSLLSLEEIQSIIPAANNDIYSVLIPSRAIISRRSGCNSSNPVQIRKFIRAVKRKLSKGAYNEADMEADSEE